MSTVLLWLRGLAAAAIGGAAGSIGAAIVDPEHFNINTGLPMLGKVAIVGGLVAAAMYLQRSPLPGVNGNAVVPVPPPPPGDKP